MLQQLHSLEFILMTYSWFFTEIGPQMVVVAVVISNNSSSSSSSSIKRLNKLCIPNSKKKSE